MPIHSHRQRRLRGHSSGLSHFYDYFTAYAAMLYNWLHQPGYPALFCLSFLASSLLPLGSEWLLVLMLAGGYGAFPAVTTATAGNYLGAVTTYLVGLWGSCWLVEKVLRISPQQQERAVSYYRRYGAYSLLFSWLPLIGDPLCLAAGMLRVDFWRFTLLVVAGKLARYAVTAWITLGII